MKKPKYFPKDTPLLLNKRKAEGLWEPCIVLGVETIWHTSQEYYHLYRVSTQSGGIRKNIPQDQLK